MKPYTQTAPNNCWQTAIASILDVDPESLPSQLLYDQDFSARPDEFGGWGSYSNVLNGYLGKHYGLLYSELHCYQWGAIATLREDLPTMGYHVMTGPTVRTPDNGWHHVVVAKHGEMVWDPHPSRAGLTEILEWGILGPLPQRIIEQRERLMQVPSNAALRRIYGCLCPLHA